MHTLVGYALFPQYFQTPEIKYLINHKSENYDYRLSQLSLLTYENNYDIENLKNREEMWLREIFGRRQFSTGGLVGGWWPSWNYTGHMWQVFRVCAFS